MFSWNRLSPGLRALFFVQVVNRMGDFVVPFLTLILTQVQHLPPAAAGLVVTLASALGSLGGLWAGRLGDRGSRRDVLVLFLGTGGLLVGAAGFAPAHAASAVALVASGFFVGAMRPLLGAIVADLASPETRRDAFGLSYLGINLGVSIGPLLAGWLFNHALPWMFWLDALSTACALLVLVRFVPRHTNPPVPATEEPRPRGSSVGTFVLHPILFPFSLLTLAYNFVYAQMVFTLALQLVDLFGTQGPPTFGLVWAVNAVAVLVMMPLVLRGTRRWTNLASMALGMAFFAAGTAVFLFRPDLVWVLVSTLLWTAGEVFFSAQHGDLVSAHSPPDLRARFQAYTGFLTSLGFVVAPVVGGLVAQTLGLPGVWVLSTSLVAFVGLGYLLLDRKGRAP
jgi:MFS family permease